MSDPEKITVLLQAAARGNQTASRRLIDVVHRELKQVAQAKMAGEDANHTLQPTALINEIFTRLFHRTGPDSSNWLLNSMDIQSRSHFLSIAAAQMRHLLIDHARKKRAVKRNFGVRIPIEDADRSAESGKGEVDVEELDKYLAMLAAHDRRAAEVVEMKFFGGMTDKEVAAKLNEAFVTVRRDWEFARKFLKVRMQKNEKPE